MVEGAELNWDDVCQPQFLQGKVMEKRGKGSLGQGSLGQGSQVWEKAEVEIQGVKEKREKRAVMEESQRRCRRTEVQGSQGCHWGWALSRTPTGGKVHRMLGPGPPNSVF